MLAVTGCTSRHTDQIILENIAPLHTDTKALLNMGKDSYEKGSYKMSLQLLLRCEHCIMAQPYKSTSDSITAASCCNLLASIYNMNGLPYHAGFYADEGIGFCSTMDSATAQALLYEKNISEAACDSCSYSKAAYFAKYDHSILAGTYREHTFIRYIRYLRLFYIGLFFALVFVAIMIYALYRKRKRARELNYLITTCDTLNAKLKDMDSLLTRTEQEKDRGTYLQGLFVNLYKKEFKDIGNLCNVFLTDRSRDKQENVYREVEKIAEKIQGSNSTNSQFERMLDERLDNVMSKIRTDFPDMEEAEYRFISYCIAGFSASFIAVLMPELYVPSIYVKKGRIAKKLTSKDGPNAELYRSLLA